MKRNDDAMSPAAMIFSIFCLFCLIAVMVLIVANATNTPSYSDTYGNSMSSVDAAANGTQGLTANLTATGTSVTAPVIILAAVVFICFCAFLVYAVVKNH